MALGRGRCVACLVLFVLLAIGAHLYTKRYNEIAIAAKPADQIDVDSSNNDNDNDNDGDVLNKVNDNGIIVQNDDLIAVNKINNNINNNIDSIVNSIDNNNDSKDPKQKKTTKTKTKTKQSASTEGSTVRWVPLANKSKRNATEETRCCVYKGECDRTCDCYENETEASECIAKEFIVSHRGAVKCPNNCSNRGKCIKGECICDGSADIELSPTKVRYFGLDCSMKTEPGQLVPSFLIIGTQKGGTTALFYEIIKHPQVMAVPSKEKHYFDRNAQGNVHAYLQAMMEFNQTRMDRLQDLAKSGVPVITGEATPVYMYLCDGARQIYSLFPHIKLIVSLRDPVDRVFSNFAQRRRNYNKTKSLDSMVDSAVKRLKQCLSVETSEVEWRDPCCAVPGDDSWESGGMLGRGIYVKQIQELLKFFPKEQIHFINFTEFFKDPKATLKGVGRFLGLNAYDYPDIYQPPAAVHAVTQNETISMKTRQRLKKFFAPFNEQLFSLMGVDYGWND